MTKISIPYNDNRTVTFEIPDRNLSEILRPNKVEVPENPQKLVEQVLQNPTGSEKVEQIVKQKESSGKTGKKQVCIICDDITRKTPVHLIIPSLLERLNSAGINDKDIFIVIALGTHRPMTEAEMIEKVGQEAYSRVKVYNSEFKDKKNGMVKVGKADDGVDIWIDKRVACADIKIGLGAIVPHPAAGCGGGAKIIFPGVAGEETVASFHLQYSSTPENMFGAPTSPSGESMEKWVEMLNLDFIFNFILTDQGQVYNAVAGHFIKAHRKGVELMKNVFGIRAKEKVDIAVSSSYPATLDFWQATKAVFGPDLWTTSGGSIILVTDCSEGFGPHPQFADYIGNDDPEQLLKDAYQGKTTDPIAVSGGVTLGRMRKRKRFCLVSENVGPEYARVMKMNYFSDLQQAVDSEMKRYGEDVKLGVITHGGCSYPIL